MEALLSESRIDALADRIMRLERENRQLKWFGTASILGIVILVGIGAAWGQARVAPAEKVIRAESFIAVDKDGKGVIGIGANIKEKTRGAIEFLDQTGKTKMTLGLDEEDAPFIVLTGRDGRDQLTLEVQPGKGMAISLKDTKQDSGLLLGTSPEGVAACGFMGQGGKLLMDLGVNPDGSSRLIIRDMDGKELQKFPMP
jgi:hypothetical protein